MIPRHMKFYTREGKRYMAIIEIMHPRSLHVCRPVMKTATQAQEYAKRVIREYKRLKNI